MGKSNPDEITSGIPTGFSGRNPGGIPGGIQEKSQVELFEKSLSECLDEYLVKCLKEYQMELLENPWCKSWRNSCWNFEEVSGRILGVICCRILDQTQKKTWRYAWQNCWRSFWRNLKMKRWRYGEIPGAIAEKNGIKRGCSDRISGGIPGKILEKSQVPRGIPGKVPERIHDAIAGESLVEILGEFILEFLKRSLVEFLEESVIEFWRNAW